MAVGSVKDLRVQEPPTTASLGAGSFWFSDAYSVFDWGRMPDPIPSKGASLCAMGAYTFERLEAAGIATHYEGVPQDGEHRSIEDVTEPPVEMTIQVTNVPALPHTANGYDYDAYHQAAADHYLIPLEVVFRNTVPIGSSLRKRTTPADHSLDWPDWPDEPLALTEPIVEFSTKYEEQDRYLARQEADAIAGAAPIDDLAATARQVNAVITDRAEETGLVHHDGKIECLYHHGDIIVADVAGTFDENRFAYHDYPVSKEVLRQYYTREHPEWVEDVTAAKTTAADRGIADWKSLCTQEPAALPASIVRLARDLYTAGANAYLDTPLFEAPGLSEVVDRAAELVPIGTT